MLDRVLEQVLTQALELRGERLRLEFGRSPDLRSELLRLDQVLVLDQDVSSTRT